MYFINLRSFCILFLQIFFMSLSLLFFWDPITHMLVCFMESYKSLIFCLLFFILFSFCSSDWIISIDLFLSSLILSSANSNILLSFSSELFILVIIIFSSRMAIWFSFIYIYIYIYIYICVCVCVCVCVYWYIIIYIYNFPLLMFSI